VEEVEVLEVKIGVATRVRGASGGRLQASKPAAPVQNEVVRRKWPHNPTRDEPLTEAGLSTSVKLCHCRGFYSSIATSNRESPHSFPEPTHTRHALCIHIPVP